MPFVPNAEAVSCVYWVHRPEHTDILRQGYVGISRRFERRIWEHLNLNQNRHLKNAIKKYGWDSLVKEKVLIGKEDYCLEIEAKLRPADKIGWNLVKGGNKPPVNRWNAGTKGLMTSWLKGKSLPEEIKAKVSVGVKKLWQDPEYRQRMSDVHKGKSNFTGKKHSPETIEKIRLAKIGKKPSIETRKKMSESQQKRQQGVA
tara:strand:+ start:229 stop:831 length:603 start_codon:yes stop_codon:yes gene_type:complete